jgi:hypothetical protein
MFVALMGGCSTGARVTTTRALAPLSVSDPNLLPTTDPNPPTAVTQAAGSCWSSVSCCVQNHPLTPVQSCGADPLKAAEIARCKQEKWVGNCYDCIRRCEGQHEWPQDMCPDPQEQN